MPDEIRICFNTNTEDFFSYYFKLGKNTLVKKFVSKFPRASKRLFYSSKPRADDAVNMAIMKIKTATGNSKSG